MTRLLLSIIARLTVCGLGLGTGMWPAYATAQTADDDEPARTRQGIRRRQQEAKQDELVPHVVSPAEERVRFLETWRLPRRLFAKGVRGFRPVIGGMPSGSGFVEGGGYIAGYNNDLLQGTANARYSTRGFSEYDAGLIMLTRVNNLSPVEGFLTAGYRDYTALRYFGLGGDSSRGDRTTYGLEDRYVDLGFRA